MTTTDGEKQMARKIKAATKPAVKSLPPFSDDNVLLRLSDDLRAATGLFGLREVRSHVDTYYAMQRVRIATENLARALEDSGEPNSVAEFISKQQGRLEKQVMTMLDNWSADNLDCQWLRQVVGIGPVISSGLVAHIDITKAATAGAIWRFAGLDPTAVWLPKTKRPWNDKLKVLAWKAGKSFVMQSGNEECFYGHLYKARREQEELRNKRGDYANEAINVLLTRNFRDMASRRNMPQEEMEKEIQTTVGWYKKGMFPPGRIQLRATRYACTIFLSHLHEVMFYNYYRRAAPRPYVYDYGPENHPHIIEPPHLDKSPHLQELQEALRQRQPTLSLTKFIEKMPYRTPKPRADVPTWFDSKREIPLDLLRAAQQQRREQSQAEPFEEIAED